MPTLLFSVLAVTAILFICFVILKNTSFSIVKTVLTISTLTSFLACVVVLIISVVYTSNISLVPTVESSQELVNLKDNRDTKGNFFLGCGEIDTKQYYYFYYKTESGFKADKVSTDSCEIIYTDDTPHIDTISLQPVKEEYNLLTIEPLLGLKTLLSPSQYKLYIPKGSITTDFAVDME